jgi:hypothetical protein
MEGRSIERVPVEIWTVILRRAIATPVLPFFGESHDFIDSEILLNLRLFAPQCELHREARQVQRTVSTFRLVCHLWNSILSNFRSNCVITNYESHNYPTKDIKGLGAVERLYVGAIDEETFCFCSRSPTRANCFLKMLQPDVSTQEEAGWWEDLGDERLKSLLYGVRIFSLDNWGFDIHRLIVMMPKIRAMSINFIYQELTEKIILPFTFLSSQSQLTHLKLATLDWTTFRNQFHPQVPHLRQLRYLDLVFYSSQAGHPAERELKWNLPKLESLMMRGSIEPQGKEEVTQFVQQCRQNLKGFVDTVQIYAGSALTRSSGPPQESQFPRLHTYGTDMFNINTHSIEATQTESTGSRTLIIYSFNSGLYDGEITFIAARLISYMRKWAFSQAILPTSWHSLKSSFYSSRSSKWPLYRGFFGEFMKTDLKFSDSEGIELRDPHCYRFWEEDISK